MTVFTKNIWFRNRFLTWPKQTMNDENSWCHVRICSKQQPMIQVVRIWKGPFFRTRKFSLPLSRYDGNDDVTFSLIFPGKLNVSPKVIKKNYYVSHLKVKSTWLWCNNFKEPPVLLDSEAPYNEDDPINYAGFRTFTLHYIHWIIRDMAKYNLTLK